MSLYKYIEMSLYPQKCPLSLPFLSLRGQSYSKYSYVKKNLSKTCILKTYLILQNWVLNKGVNGLVPQSMSWYLWWCLIVRKKKGWSP